MGQTDRQTGQMDGYGVCRFIDPALHIVQKILRYIAETFACRGKAGSVCVCCVTGPLKMFWPRVPSESQSGPVSSLSQS